MEPDKQQSLRAGYVLDMLVWLLFCATCVQVGFRQPSVLLIPGERTNLFSGLLCCITLLGALLVAKKRGANATLPELLASLALLILGLVSGYLNSPSSGSSYRAVVLLASGLGGFWTARILLNSQSRVDWLVRLSAGILAGQILLGLWGYYLEGKVDAFLYGNPHPVIGTLFLLAFAPMAMTTMRRPSETVAGLLLLSLTYVTLFAASLQVVTSGVLIPLVLVILIPVVERWGSKRAGALLILVIVITGLSTYFFSHLSPKEFHHPAYQAYRIESYPFSWHIASKHPVWGIGLRTPRDEYVSDYSVSHPQFTKERFENEVRKLVTHENAYLTLMTGLGLPFLCLYAGALLILMARLVRGVFRCRQGPLIEQWTLLVPLVASLLHSLVVDTLLYPQIAWYFHILLGLIPRNVTEPAQQEETVRAPVRNISWTAGAVLVGIVLGTHPALSPERLPTKHEIYRSLVELPIVKVLLERKEPAPARVLANPQVVPHEQVKIGPGPQPKISKASSRSSESGVLTVTIRNQEALPASWAVMLILDNARAMLPDENPDHIDGRRAAFELISDLARKKPSDCSIGLRLFFPEVIRRGDKQVPIRASVGTWIRDSGIHSADMILSESEWGEDNDLCSAVARSMRTDFSGVGHRIRRIALVTGDRSARCGLDSLADLPVAPSTGNISVDVIAIGAQTPRDTEYSRLVASRNGMFVRITSSEQASQAVDEYLRSISKSRSLDVEVTGGESSHRLRSGESITLPPGSYSLVLPEVRGGDHVRKTIDGVEISSGITTAVEVDAIGPQIHVEKH